MSALGSIHLVTKLLALGILVFPSLALSNMKGFDAFVQSRLKASQIPGLAIAIAKGNKTLWKKAYGLRRTDSRERVTPTTVFPVGSITKSFTATAILLLIKRKQLSLSTRIITILPEFRLSDPIATKSATIMDALTHLLGISDDGILWYGTGKSMNELFHSLHKIPSASGFRKKWGYSNLGFVILGKIIAKVSGTSWVDFVRKELLEPLGMNDTYMTFKGFSRVKDRVFPHSESDQSVMQERGADEVGPAGGLSSTLHDLLTWTYFQMKGKEGILASHNLSQLHKPQVMLDPVPTFPKPEFRDPAYGLGWFVDQYRDEKLVWHTGGHGGYTARVAFLPRYQISVVVLANQENVHAETRYLTLRAIDLATQKPPIDWHTRSAKK